MLDVTWWFSQFMLGRLKSPVIMTVCVFILFPNLDRDRSSSSIWVPWESLWGTVEGAYDYGFHSFYSSFCQMLSLLVFKFLRWVVMTSALDIWNTPSISACFPVFSKKCSGKISPFLTEGSNHDSVAWSCRLFSALTTAAFFLMLWQFMRMHRKFGLWMHCQYPLNKGGRNAS